MSILCDNLRQNGSFINGKWTMLRSYDGDSWKPILKRLNLRRFVKFLIFSQYTTRNQLNCRNRKLKVIRTSTQSNYAFYAYTVFISSKCENILERFSEATQLSSATKISTQIKRKVKQISVSFPQYIHRDILAYYRYKYLQA